MKGVEMLGEERVSDARDLESTGIGTDILFYLRAWGEKGS